MNGSFELRVVSVGDERFPEGDYILRIPVVLVDEVEAFEAKEMDFEGAWVGRLEEALARLTAD